MQHLVIIEEGANSYGTHVPDLPGCVVVGETKAEVHRMITETIQFHLEGLREDGVVVPPPSPRRNLLMWLLTNNQFHSSNR